MSIIRAPRKESNFYVLDKQISEDRRLTWAARGLLIFLLGKPDNWTVIVQALINETKGTRKPLGRDGVYALLDELIQAGYVKRRQDRNPAGVLGEVHYIVSESPLPANPDPVDPLPAEPDTAEPLPANPTLPSIEGYQGRKDEQGAQAPAAPASQLDLIAQAAAQAEADRLAAEQAEAAAAAAKATAKPEVVDCPDGVSAEVWTDFLKTRKAKRAPLTATALRGIEREAAKAGVSLDDALAICCERGWVGFRADWHGVGVPTKTAARQPANENFDAKDYGTRRKL